MRILFAALLIAVPVYAGEAAPSKQELELQLRVVQADKEKFIARFNWGQQMMDEATRALPGLVQQEQDILKLLDGAKAPVPPAKAPEKPK